MNKYRKLNFIFAIVFIIIGIFLISISMKTIESKHSIYTYKIKKDLESNVQLKSNSFYDSNLLSNQPSYPSNLVDKMNIVYNYSYTGNKTSNYKYNYNLVAYLVGNYNDKEIWRKSYVFIPNTNNTSVNSNKISINQPISIDYQYYKSIVNQFNLNTNLTTEAYLLVELNINITNNINLVSKPEKLSDTMKVKIPINNYATEIKNLSRQATTNSIYYTKNNNSSRIILVIVGLLCIIISIIIALFNKKNKQISASDLYHKNINQLLKDYPDLIVSVLNKPDIESLNCMQIEKFEDLIDVAEQNKTNIILFETKKDKKSNLYVILDKFAYVYPITSKKII